MHHRFGGNLDQFARSRIASRSWPLKDHIEYAEFAKLQAVPTPQFRNHLIEEVLNDLTGDVLLLPRFHRDASNEFSLRRSHELPPYRFFIRTIRVTTYLTTAG